MRQVDFSSIALWIMAISIILGCGGENVDQPGSGLSSERSLNYPQANSPEDLQSADSFDLETELNRAVELAKNGDLESASDVLQRILLSDPTNVEALFRLARIRYQTRDLATAIELLDSIPAEDPNAGLPALGQSADWCLEAERYQEAEER